MYKKFRKKILYETGEYPDNYTDETFLSDLQKNVEFQEVNLLEAIKGATLIIQELCTVIIFVLVYVYMYNELIYPETLFYFSSAFTIIGYLIYKVFYSSDTTKTWGKDLRTVLIFVVFGYQFSPVLYTLTDTVSTDTIYTMTFFMMLVHMIFFNYGVSAAIVSNSLSLNSAIFASVCLASRLSSAYHAFVLLSIAVKCFVLFPLLRNKIKDRTSTTVVLVSVVIFGIIPVSFLMAMLFVLTLIFINFICPMMFVRYQKYKDNIYGPWDEAVVDDTDNETNKLYC